MHLPCHIGSPVAREKDPRVAITCSLAAAYAASRLVQALCGQHGAGAAMGRPGFAPIRLGASSAQRFRLPGLAT